MWFSHPVCIISNETGEGCRVEGISQRSLRSFGHWIFLVSRNLVTPLSPMSLPEQGQLVWLVVSCPPVHAVCASVHAFQRGTHTCQFPRTDSRPSPSSCSADTSFLTCLCSKGCHFSFFWLVTVFFLLTLYQALGLPTLSLASLTACWGATPSSVVFKALPAWPACWQCSFFAVWSDGSHLFQETVESERWFLSCRNQQWPAVDQYKNIGLCH